MNKEKILADLEQHVILGNTYINYHDLVDVLDSLEQEDYKSDWEIITDGCAADGETAEIDNAQESDKEIAKRMWGEWVDYMNEYEPCPMGDRRIPPLLLDWLDREDKCHS